MRTGRGRARSAAHRFAPLPTVTAALALTVVLLGVLPAAATNGTVWTTLPSTPTVRWGLAAAAAPCPVGQTGTCVYSVGGNSGGTSTGTTESYNRLTNAWSTVSPLSVPRRRLAAAAAPCPVGQSGTCVYSVGGLNTADATVATVESYNPATNAWSSLPAMPTPRAALASTAGPCPLGQAGTCVYAIGGNTGTANVATVESYNPVTNAWSTLPPLSAPRIFLAAATAPCPAGQSGTCVYATGGNNGTANVATVESYNPATNAWSPVTALPGPRSDLAAAAAPCPVGQAGTCVYAVGGSAPGATGTVESYNPASNVWTTLPAMPTPRLALGAATTVCPPGQTGTCVYAVGGLAAGGAPTGTLEALDPPPAPSDD
ncbi:Kelch repeat-containing protein [Streptomyces sp. NPDC053493]|uniref:Kelch repeat-containing protein n=1 Tax=Streptomyces sp. NPDC053493 TaxID=3365705 RepID=UPI0037CF0889